MPFWYNSHLFASVAQRIEQRPSNPLVARSSRVGGTIKS